MFDIGFWELVTIGVVALLVLGPERLPSVARTAGLWFGKARHFLASVKADIDREIKAEELKQIMEQQAKSAGLYDIVEETKSALDDVSKDVKAAAELSPPANAQSEPPATAEQGGAVQAHDHDAKQ